MARRPLTRVSAGGRSEGKAQSAKPSITTPPAIRALPESQPTTRPAGTVFSTSTNVAIAATQARFMTPPTNSSAIRAQQRSEERRVGKEGRPSRKPGTKVRRAQGGAGAGHARFRLLSYL